MRFLTLSIFGFVMFFALNTSLVFSAQDKDPKELIQKVTDTDGSYEKLKSLKDVEYKYTYKSDTSDKADISIEKYIFDGELSWAEYKSREYRLMPDKPGKLIQGYNGQESWATIDGKLVDDPKILKSADFLRKTNFYWFAMMQKLQDPGSILTYVGKKNHNDITYELVKLTFEAGVGDVSDIYLLYINPETNLVDQFLFTVLDFGVTEPLLMEVKHEKIDELMLPTYRRYTQSKLEAKVI